MGHGPSESLIRSLDRGAGRAAPRGPHSARSWPGADGRSRRATSSGDRDWPRAPLSKAPASGPPSRCSTLLSTSRPPPTSSGQLAAGEISEILDLGCGTGAAGAAWALGHGGARQDQRVRSERLGGRRGELELPAAGGPGPGDPTGSHPGTVPAPAGPGDPRRLRDQRAGRRRARRGSPAAPGRRPARRRRPDGRAHRPPAGALVERVGVGIHRRRRPRPTSGGCRRPFRRASGSWQNPPA